MVPGKMITLWTELHNGKVHLRMALANQIESVQALSLGRRSAEDGSYTHGPGQFYYILRYLQ
jgi:hypothetical protein